MSKITARQAVGGFRSAFRGSFRGGLVGTLVEETIYSRCFVKQRAKAQAILSLHVRELVSDVRFGQSV